MSNVSKISYDAVAMMCGDEFSPIQKGDRR
jgi:hypothetical protein